jgi:hypothetical protein
MDVICTANKIKRSVVLDKLMASWLEQNGNGNGNGNGNTVRQEPTVTEPLNISVGNAQSEQSSSTIFSGTRNSTTPSAQLHDVSKEARRQIMADRIDRLAGSEYAEVVDEVLSAFERLALKKGPARDTEGSGIPQRTLSEAEADRECAELERRDRATKADIDQLEGNLPARNKAKPPARERIRTK